jgi:hypothetical protein
MRTKVKTESSELALMRILDAFAGELIDVSDEEILAAAQGLGMDLRKSESAAFAGVTYPARWQLSDFFDVDTHKGLQTPPGRIAVDPPAEQKNNSRRSKRPRISSERKNPGSK